MKNIEGTAGSETINEGIANNLGHYTLVVITPGNKRTLPGFNSPENAMAVIGAFEEIAGLDGRKGNGLQIIYRVYNSRGEIEYTSENR